MSLQSSNYLQNRERTKARKTKLQTKGDFHLKTMPTKPDSKDNTVAGYSGSPHEGKSAPTRPKEASKDAVVSPLGHTEPAIVLAGDGVTPVSELEAKKAKKEK